MSESSSRKSTYHSTVGRRDFLKMLGLGAGVAGAGALGLGATAETSFADLDDMMASPYADRNLPWWVKEVNEPTVQIDWDNMEVFPGVHKTLFNPKAWDNPQEYMKIHAQNISSTTEKVKNNVRAILSVTELWEMPTVGVGGR